MRSGGYTKNDELEDALFAFGRNYTEVKEFPKCRLPTGIVNLLRRKKLDKIAIETGFFIEISLKKRSLREWCRFEQIMSVKPKSHHYDHSQRAIFSIFDGFDTFELGTNPWSEFMPSQLWVKLSPLDDQTLAWVLSEGKILCGDINEQKTLHDFYEIEISGPKTIEYLRLPPPPDRPYNFFDEF